MPWAVSFDIKETAGKQFSTYWQPLENESYELE